MLAIDRELGPVAVILDLVEPRVAFGRLVDERREHRLDEAGGHDQSRHRTPGRDPDRVS